MLYPDSVLRLPSPLIVTSPPWNIPDIFSPFLFYWPDDEGVDYFLSFASFTSLPDLSLYFKAIPLRIQECLESRFEDVGFPSPAFPYDQNPPAKASEFSDISAVTISVAAALVVPEFSVCSRFDSAITAIMHVPEAAVNKNDLFMSCKNKIGFSWQIFSVETKPVAHAVEH